MINKNLLDIKYKPEIFIVMILLMLLFMQFSFTPATFDPDPDGYVSYAKHIQENWSLMPEHIRMPGYPFFIAITHKSFNYFFKMDMHKSVFWMQVTIAFIFITFIWLVVRIIINPFVGIIFLAILAAPNYYVRYATVMLSDFLYSVFFLLVLLAIFYYFFKSKRNLNWLLLCIIGFGVFILQLIKPITFSLMIMLTFSIITISVLYKVLSFNKKNITFNLLQISLKVFTFLVVILCIFLIIRNFIETKSSTSNWAFTALAGRIAACLPPVKDSPAEYNIEEAKKVYFEKTGQHIEDSAWWEELYHQTYAAKYEDANAVWKDRLKAYPLKYAISILNEIRWRHHKIAQNYLPFFAFRDDNWMPFIEKADTISSKIFRLSGIELKNLYYIEFKNAPIHDKAPLWKEVIKSIYYAILELLCMWVPLSIGLKYFLKNALIPILSLCLWIIFIIIFYSGFGLLLSRYFLPFAIPLYILQSVGIYQLGLSFLENVKNKDVFSNMNINFH